MTSARPVMMACGHSANGVNRGAPVCVICVGIVPGARQVVTAPDLAGRIAQCSYGDHRPVPSSIALPFFEYRPSEPEDLYYCGCFGWD